MAYLMVHITIGFKLLSLCPNIDDKGAFLLGTISPDAISFRPGCKRSDKSITHFCVGDEGWGYYTNYIEDCAEIDSILLNDIENIDGLWSMLEYANKHCLAGLFTTKDNSYLINAMKTDMYHNRLANTAYIPSILTMPKVLQFMDDVVCKVLQFKQ